MRNSNWYIIFLFVTFFMLSGCLTEPLVDLREQSYSSSESVLQFSMDRVEENLGFYYAKCGGGRWLRRPKKGIETREMVLGKRVNAREYRVDGWMEFSPLGATRTQVRLHFTPAVRNEIFTILRIIQDPTVCR